MKHLLRLFILPLLCLATTAGAQERSVSTVNEVAIGHTQTLDTYLSPEHYTGTELRFICERSVQREGRKWSRLVVNESLVSDANADGGGGNELALLYGWQHTWLRTWIDCVKGLKLSAGPSVTAHIGGCYNTRNSNNPAQMYCDLAAAVSASAEYGCRILRKDIGLGYRIDLPLLGFMFSPNYGQSYYEIFSRGNYDHNIVPTTPVSRPTMRQQLYADVRMGKTTWRIGYLGDYRQASINNIKQHQYTHAFLIGMKF